MVRAFGSQPAAAVEALRQPLLYEAATIDNGDEVHTESLRRHQSERLRQIDTVMCLLSRLDACELVESQRKTA